MLHGSGWPGSLRRDSVAKATGLIPKIGQRGSRAGPAFAFSAHEAAVWRDRIVDPSAAALLRAFEFLSQRLGQPSAQLGQLLPHFDFCSAASRRDDQETEGRDDAGQHDAGDIGSGCRCSKRHQRAEPRAAPPAAAAVVTATRA